jgi:hypothetical protein
VRDRRAGTVKAWEPQPSATTGTTTLPTTRGWWASRPSTAATCWTWAAATADRAIERVTDLDDVQVSRTSFKEFDPGTRRFDLVTFVASLHHMDLRTSLARARDLLAPSGEIAVVGLWANESAWDWVWSACCVPAVMVGDRLHRDTPDIGVTIAEPRESLRAIRRTTAEVLPGAVIRRKLYYRYLLRWSS